MTALLDEAVAAVRSLPVPEQDEIARLMLRLIGDEAIVPVALTEDEKAAVARSKAAAERGEFATEADVRAVLDSHGL